MNALDHGLHGPTGARGPGGLFGLGDRVAFTPGILAGVATGRIVGWALLGDAYNVDPDDNTIGIVELDAVDLTLVARAAALDDAERDRPQGGAPEPGRAPRGPLDDAPDLPLG